MWVQQQLTTLAQEGAKIVGIVDRDGGLINRRWFFVSRNYKFVSTIRMVIP